MADKELVKISYDFGAKAFRDGKMCVPAWDKVFMALMGKAKEPLLPFIKAWQKGYLDETMKGGI